MVTVRSLCRFGLSGQLNPAPMPTTRPAATRAASLGRQRLLSTASANQPPASPTAKLTNGAPQSGANQRSGDSAWLNAQRPQGKPPNGSRSRTDSSATHSAPTATGAHRVRWATGSSAPRPARYQVWENTSTNQGAAPT